MIVMVKKMISWDILCLMKLVLSSYSSGLSSDNESSHKIDYLEYWKYEEISDTIGMNIVVYRKGLQLMQFVKNKIRMIEFSISELLGSINIRGNTLQN